VLRQRLAESLAGKSFLKQALYHMGVLAIKADLRYLLLNRFRAVQPK
jgi:hypothetical protein